jgi:hypothetical protein
LAADNRCQLTPDVGAIAYLKGLLAQEKGKPHTMTIDISRHLVATITVAATAMEFFMGFDPAELAGLPVDVLEAIERYDLTGTREGKGLAISELKRAIDKWLAADRHACLHWLAPAWGIEPPARPKLEAHIAAELERIAQDHGFGDLRTRNRDSSDFRSVAVWNLREALEQAYLAGRAAVQR